MSYTPTIVINKKEFDKHADKFERDWEWVDDDELERVMRYLKFVYQKHDVVKIKDVELILCEPEFSSFNADVRTKLSEWGVEFGLSN